MMEKKTTRPPGGLFIQGWSNRIFWQIKIWQGDAYITDYAKAIVKKVGLGIFGLAFNCFPKMFHFYVK